MDNAEVIFTQSKAASHSLAAIITPGALDGAADTHSPAHWKRIK